MDFVIEWFWYLLAFVVGSAAAWGITVALIPHTSEEQAVAGLPGSGEMGAQ